MWWPAVDSAWAQTNGHGPSPTGIPPQLTPSFPAAGAQDVGRHLRAVAGEPPELVPGASHPHEQQAATAGLWLTGWGHTGRVTKVALLAVPPRVPRKRQSSYREGRW